MQFQKRGGNAKKAVFLKATTTKGVFLRGLCVVPVDFILFSGVNHEWVLEVRTNAVESSTRTPGFDEVERGRKRMQMAMRASFWVDGQTIRLVWKEKRKNLKLLSTDSYKNLTNNFTPM